MVSQSTETVTPTCCSYLGKFELSPTLDSSGQWPSTHAPHPKKISMKPDITNESIISLLPSQEHQLIDDSCGSPSIQEVKCLHFAQASMIITMRQGDSRPAKIPLARRRATCKMYKPRHGVQPSNTGEPWMQRDARSRFPSFPSSTSQVHAKICPLCKVIVFLRFAIFPVCLQYSCCLLFSKFSNVLFLFCPVRYALPCSATSSS